PQAGCLCKNTEFYSVREKMQGRREEKRAIAASLLESGLLDAEKIATMTGLTMEEVKGLQVE
ncbi:MAG: hypothetical protein D3912_15865, partial [Candidatus Electrothrix sp. AX1]|nr:hypothetical protein [Candidatus Electrothrix sp. AX1]